MNFKKVLSIASVASLAVVGLASCGKKKEKKTVAEYTGNINVAASYNNLGYVTFGRGTGAGITDNYTTIDGRVLIPNETLAPVWQDLSANMHVTIQDASLHADTSSASFQTLANSDFVGYKDRKADIFCTSQGDDFNSKVNTGEVLNLSPYIESGKMPNLKAWLDTHGVIKDQLTVNKGSALEGIYYTPYFDGLDQEEQQFNMNIDIVRALLDEQSEQTEFSARYYDQANTGFDTVAKYTSFAYNTPFIPSMSNQEIAVARQTQTGLNTAGTGERIDDNLLTTYGNATYVADKITVNIPAGQDIITQMNNLEVKSGKALRDCLRSYLETTYGAYVGPKKLFAHYSDIFVSGSACYNTDELIALLRVVYANPAFLTGNASSAMMPFFPRTGQANRVRRLISFVGQIFGERGLEGENGKFWFNANGKLTDGSTQDYSLYCLQMVNTLKQDHIFPETTNWRADGTTESKDYRSTHMKTGTAFMINDMANTAANDNYKLADGSTKETIAANKCFSATGVLPPVTKWGFRTTDGAMNVNSADPNSKLIVGAKDNFSYTRFSEDDRTLKSGGFSVVASSVKGDESKLNKVLEILDYMYTPEGSVLECFGFNDQAPEERKDKVAKKASLVAGAENDLVAGSEYILKDPSGSYYVNITDAYKTEQVAKTGGTWHNFMTEYWGACFGVGNIRTNLLESQMTTEMQKLGILKLGRARNVGAYYLATTTGSNYLKTVPTSIVYTDEMKTANGAADPKAISDFYKTDWKAGQYAVAYGGWSTSTTLKTAAEVKAKYAAYNNSILKNAGAIWEVQVDSENQYPYISFTL